MIENDIGLFKLQGDDTLQEAFTSTVTGFNANVDVITSLFNDINTDITSIQNNISSFSSSISGINSDITTINNEIDDINQTLSTKYTIGGVLTALTISNTLNILSDEDVSLTSTANPIQIGPTTGVNLVIDNNEIMARNNSANSILYLNADGGDISIGGNILLSEIELKGKLNLDNCAINSKNISYYADDGSQRYFLQFVEPVNGVSSQGCGVKLGAGNGVLIASGECGYTALEDPNVDIGNTEYLYIMSDSGIKFSTNANTYDSKVSVLINTTPSLYVEAAGTSGKGNIGSNADRWRTIHGVTIYSNGSVVSTSDERYKQNITPLLDNSKELIMSLNPISYKYTNEIGTSNRTHYGLVAQQVKEVIDDLGLGDIGLYVESSKVEDKSRAECTYDELELGLRYEELIAPIIKVIQLQQAEIEELKAKIK